MIRQQGDGVLRQNSQIQFFGFRRFDFFAKLRGNRMPFEIPCSNPDCRQTLSFSDELMGQQVRCPKFDAVTQVLSRPKSPSG